MPVMLPPGRARLAIRPVWIGSPLMPTIGIVLVAFLAATSAGVVQVTSMSIFRPRRSAKRAGLSFGVFDTRCSMTMFFPSTYPWSRNPCRTASVKLRAGMLGASPGGARFGRPSHLLAAARRGAAWRLPRGAAHRGRCVGPSFDHLVRPLEQRRRDRQAERLRGLEVDYQLELRRLLNRQIRRLRAFEDLVHVCRGPSEQIAEVWRIGHEAATTDKFTLMVYSWQAAHRREFYELGFVRGEKR